MVKSIYGEKPEFKSSSDGWDIGIAGQIAISDFWSVDPATGQLLYWNGLGWTSGILKRWNGSSWVEANLKFWNGNQWVSLTYPEPSSSGPSLISTQTLDFGQNSSSRAVTVPADAEYFVLFWHAWSYNVSDSPVFSGSWVGGSTGYFGTPTYGLNDVGIGCFFGQVISTGSQSISITVDEEVNHGPTASIAFFKGGNASSPIRTVSFDKVQSDLAGIATASITVEASELLFAYEAHRYDNIPTTKVGTTSLETSQIYGGWYAASSKLAIYDSPSSETYNSDNTEGASVILVTIR